MMVKALFVSRTERAYRP